MTGSELQKIFGSLTQVGFYVPNMQASYLTAYDGFVVLHGTDTLTYTACALSFMMKNLGMLCEI